MQKKNLWTVIILVAIIFDMACKKGPAGPQGATGATGPAGPTGPAGSPGATGTANVIYSNWTNGSSWAIDATSGLNYFDITATSLTQDILSKGDIHVYWGVLGDTTTNVRQLPFTEIISSTTYFHNPKYSLAKIRVETNNLSMSTTNRYRYILSPGGVLGGRYARINSDNYKEAMDILGIPY